jgi:type III secretion protein V
VGMLTDYVRIALREQICHEFSDKNSLSVYLLSPDSEDLLRNSVRQTTRGGFLALDPDTRGKFIESVETLVRDSIAEGIKPVLLVAQDIRRYIWGMIKDEKFSIPVMSYSEVTPAIHVKPVDRIEL